MARKKEIGRFEDETFDVGDLVWPKPAVPGRGQFVIAAVSRVVDKRGAPRVVFRCQSPARDEKTGLRRVALLAALILRTEHAPEIPEDQASQWLWRSKCSKLDFIFGMCFWPRVIEVDEPLESLIGTNFYAVCELRRIFWGPDRSGIRSVIITQTMEPCPTGSWMQPEYLTRQELLGPGMMKEDG